MSEDLTVYVRQYTGNYNLADPTDRTTKVDIKIPAFGYDERFTFEPDTIPDVTEWSWDRLIEWIIDYPPTMREFIRTPRYINTLREIYNEHGEEIHEAWLRHRLEELVEERDAAAERHAELMKELQE